jgi:Tfp pilus assembly protein PilZ
LSPEVLKKVRIPFIRRAELAHGDHRREVFLVDLGLSGVFAELEAPLPEGDPVDVRFCLPGNENPIAARCRVAWWHPSGALPRSLPSGAGLEFVEMASQDRERVREHIIEHCRSAPRLTRFARPWAKDEDGGEPR